MKNRRKYETEKDKVLNAEKNWRQIEKRTELNKIAYTDTLNEKIKKICTEE